jgi:hypothetical protein
MAEGDGRRVPGAEPQHPRAAEGCIARIARSSGLGAAGPIAARERCPGLEPAGTAGHGSGSRTRSDAGPEWPGLAQHLTVMTADEWQAHVTREAAKAMGQWFEGRGRLHQPIAALTLPELEAMAANAIARFIVLASHRIKDQPDDAEDLTRLLLG